MPGNFQALLLLLLFVLPGFVAVEVDARRRPAPIRGTFDKTLLSILVSAILHACLLFPIVVYLWYTEFEFANLFENGWIVGWIEDHVVRAYFLILIYLLVCMGIAGASGFCAVRFTGNWSPVFSLVMQQRDLPNAVLVQMKNGDYYTGILDKIPYDHDVLHSSAKDFTITPPGRYKPKGRPWQSLQNNETILLNTSSVDAIRIIPGKVTSQRHGRSHEPPTPDANRG